ncbi:hypothetical protein F5884DRAFT_891082 [Xylogone sp. PMI_703]|nr:hypothetical protein F5884DRAFT_891082 [Xylogone sp. PMI_703]
MYDIYMWIALAGWMSNFDIGYSATVLAMQPYNTAFGNQCMTTNGQRVCQLSANQQSLGSLYILFMALRSVISSIISNHLGRRGTIQAGCVFIITGAVGMLGISGKYVAFFACTCIGGVGLGINAAMAPIYSIECAPPQKRGMLLGLYGIDLSTGLMCVATTCIGSATLTSDWAWKTPIIIQIPLACIYGLGITLFPESSRWLLIKGRKESAQRAIGRFYNLDPFSDERTDLDDSMTATTSWIEIFQRGYVIRTFTSAFVLFVAPYAALFLSDLGISNHFLINFYFSLCTVGGTLFGPFLSEYAGRRMTMAVGYFLMALCMLIVAAVGSGFGPSNQIHSVRQRTYGQTFSALNAYIFVFGCIFWTPYMLNPDYGNIGSNVGYFYLGTNIVMFCFVVILVPETGRLTLEQIDEHFASGCKAWRTSLARNSRIAKGLEQTVLKHLE